jgi:hypothetical protein
LEKEEAGEVHRSLLLLFYKYASATLQINLNG